MRDPALPPASARRVAPNPAPAPAPGRPGQPSGLAPVLALGLALGACAPAPGSAGDWGDPATAWRLTTIDGATYPAEAVLRFPEAGRIAGKAPCNSFSGEITAAYPSFAAGPLAATRMSCPELREEMLFFASLDAMTEGRIEGDTLTLSDGAGHEMVFQRAPD